MAITPPTPDQVRAINGSTLSDEQIQPFIDAAVCIVEQADMCMTGKGLSDSCKTSVAAYVAAHLMGVSGIDDKSRVKSKETFENYSVEWAQAQVAGNGIMSTTFGQAANTISGGCLQEVDKRPFSIVFGGGA